MAQSTSEYDQQCAKLEQLTNIILGLEAAETKDEMIAYCDTALTIIRDIRTLMTMTMNMPSILGTVLASSKMTILGTTVERRTRELHLTGNDVVFGLRKSIQATVNELDTLSIRFNEGTLTQQ